MNAALPAQLPILRELVNSSNSEVRVAAAETAVLLREALDETLRAEVRHVHTTASSHAYANMALDL